MLERLFKRIDDPDRRALPRVPTRLPTPRELGADIAATWLGHSTVLVQYAGLNVLTDPVWARRVSPVVFAGPKRWVPPTLPIAALPPIHVVLQSHDHYDHLDFAATRAIAARNPDALWCVPLGVASAVKQCGVRRVTEQDWWSSSTHTVSIQGPDGSTTLRTVHLDAVPAQHFSGRGLRDRDATLWCGWVLTVDGVDRRAKPRPDPHDDAIRVYYAGDTGLHPDFAAIAERSGPFDLTILPIGAYEPRWFMSAVHVNPDEAVQLWQTIADVQRDLHGRTPPPMLGVHWGTYKLTDEPMDEPPRRAAALWANADLPEELLWVLAHGQTRQTTRTLAIDPASSSP